jgi:hypothetical protein
MVTNRWLKAHIMVGTRTNVVTAIEVTGAYVIGGFAAPAELENLRK